MNVKEILLAAGKILKKRYFEKQNFSIKERYHLLSQTDLEMHEFISTHLQEQYPNYSILSETFY